MNAPSLQIPAPADGDSFAVKHALEVARSLWDCGEMRQAVVWIRRAAEAASDGGDASRVAALASAAADLGTLSVPPPARSTVPPPLPPSRVMPKPRLLPPPPAPRAIESTPPAGEVRRRVSVKVSVRDPDLLVVRTLADGEAAPAGTREAFLVMVGR